MTHPERLLKLLKSRKKGFTAMDIRERLGISNPADAFMKLKCMPVYNGNSWSYPYLQKAVAPMESGLNRYGEKVRYARYKLLP